MKKSLVEQIQMALSPDSPDAAEGNEDIRVNSLAPIGGEGGLPWRTGWGGLLYSQFLHTFSFKGGISNIFIFGGGCPDGTRDLLPIQRNRFGNFCW